MPGFLIPQTSATPLTITDVYVVASEEAMLGLTAAQTGDVAIRTDVSKSFVLSNNDYATLSNWKELLNPPDAVTSVDGLTGTVSLSSNYDSAGSAATAESNSNSYTDSSVSTHNSDTTSVHGISDTTLLATTSYVDNADSDKVDKLITTNEQTGTTYTLVLSDSSKLVELNNASAITLTVPTNSSVAYPVGTKIDLLQTGAGQVTVTPAGGVTINGFGDATKLSGQWAAASLVKRATDTWVMIGNISA